MAKRGFNQVDLAKRSGVAQTLISNYLTQSSRGKLPRLPTLLKLASALRCTLEDLTGDPNLKGAEERIPLLSGDALAVGKFYESLPDGDPLKDYIKKLIESNSGGGEEKK